MIRWEGRVISYGNFRETITSTISEELLNYLKELHSDDEEYNSLNDCKEMQFALFPPKDGIDSNYDDVSSDDEGTCRSGNLEKRILVHPISKTIRIWMYIVPLFIETN